MHVPALCHSGGSAVGEQDALQLEVVRRLNQPEGRAAINQGNNEMETVTLTNRRQKVREGDKHTSGYSVKQAGRLYGSSQTDFQTKHTK